MNSDTAASDLIAVMALIAVFVTATAIVGVALLSIPPGDAAPAMIARNVTGEDGKLSLSHDGGDPLIRGHFTILVDGVDRTDNFSLDGDFSWTTWETGQILIFDSDLSEGAYVQIVGEGVSRTGSDWLLHEIGTAEPTARPTTTAPTTVPPDAKFTANVTSGTAPLAVQFNDTSLHTPTSWLWNFGDGGTSTLQNPTHIYTAPGTYTVTLTVANAAGSDIETKTGYIVVYGCSSPGLLGTYYPTMDFKGTPVQRIDQKLRFADAEAGRIYRYDSDEENWPNSTLGKTDQFSVVYEGYLLVPTDATYTFYLTSDDGSCLWIDAVAEDADPLIDNWGYHSPEEMNSSIYLSAGSHPIKVKMFEGNGAAVLYLEWSSPDFERKPVDSFCQGTVQVSADFTATPLNGTAPLEVQFTDASTGGPTRWYWDFGDGGTSPEQSPQHTYAVPGTYTVTLTASNAYGEDTESKTAYINVGFPPVANFTANVTSGLAPLTVAFTDTSTGAPGSWSWDFGDGNTSIDQHPTHTYTAPGTYTVSLTVTRAGASDTETKTGYITVTPSSLRHDTLLNTADGKSGTLMQGGYLEFRVTGANSKVTIGGTQHDLEIGDMVKLAIGTSGKGKIYMSKSGIATFAYDDVTLFINGDESGTGKINEDGGIWIPSHEDLVSTLTLNVPPVNAWTEFTVGGTPIINHVDDNRQITLYNLMPRKDGVMNLNNRPEKVYFEGSITGYTLG